MLKTHTVFCISICVISLRLQTKSVIPNKSDPIKSFDALGWHIFTSQSVHYFNMPPDPSKFLFRRIPKIIISLNTNKNSKSIIFPLALLSSVPKSHAHILSMELQFIPVARGQPAWIIP